MAARLYWPPHHPEQHCIWMQAEDAQLLIAALQGIAAKQFKVLAAGIKQLQQQAASQQPDTGKQ